MKSGKQQNLERELQRESRAERPRFSESRHARIMQAVADASRDAVDVARGTTTPDQPTPTVRSRVTRVWVALALSLLITAVLAGRHVGQLAPQQDRLPAVAEIDLTAPRPDELPAGGIDNAVAIVKLAVNEIQALNPVDLSSQSAAEFSSHVAPDETLAQNMLAMAEVDEATMKQWSDVQGDARLMASFVTGPLPHGLLLRHE